MNEPRGVWRRSRFRCKDVLVSFCAHRVAWANERLTFPVADPDQSARLGELTAEPVQHILLRAHGIRDRHKIDEAAFLVPRCARVSRGIGAVRDPFFALNRHHTFSGISLRLSIAPYGAKTS